MTKHFNRKVIDTVEHLKFSTVQQATQVTTVDSKRTYSHEIRCYKKNYLQ